MKPLRLTIFVTLVSLAFAGSLLAKEKDRDEDDSDASTAIDKLTLVRDAGSKFESVKKFKPTDTLGVLVHLTDVKDGTKVRGVWTVVDAGGMKDKKIFDKEVTMDAESLKKATVKDRVDFTLSHDNPYPTGDYKFDVYLNGEAADSIEFAIED